MEIPPKVLTQKRLLEKLMQNTDQPGQPFKNLRSFIGHFQQFPEMARQFLIAAGYNDLLIFLSTPGNAQKLLAIRTKSAPAICC